MKIKYLWTPYRDYWLKNHAKDHTLKELSGHLGISKEVIKNRLKHLGLECKPSPHPGRPKTKIEIPKERIPEITWTSEQDQILIDGVEKFHYPYKTISRILLPGMSIWQCEKRYIQLKRKGRKISLTLEQIQGMDLLPSQKEMAINLWHDKPLYAYNYIKNIKDYKIKTSEVLCPEVKAKLSDGL
jgi:hypothetical protein